MTASNISFVHFKRKRKLSVVCLVIRLIQNSYADTTRVYSDFVLTTILAPRAHIDSGDSELIRTLPRRTHHVFSLRKIHFNQSNGLTFVVSGPFWLLRFVAPSIAYKVNTVNSHEIDIKWGEKFLSKVTLLCAAQYVRWVRFPFKSDHQSQCNKTVFKSCSFSRSLFHSIYIGQMLKQRCSVIKREYFRGKLFPCNTILGPQRAELKTLCALMERSRFGSAKLFIDCFTMDVELCLRHVVAKTDNWNSAELRAKTATARREMDSSEFFSSFLPQQTSGWE